MQFARVLPIIALLASSLLLGRPADAAGPVPGTCVRGTLQHGAISLICIPSSGWNGDLVMLAHGYVAFDQPLDLHHLVLPDGTFVPTLLQSAGFAFATTSYRTNGLAVLQGVDDLRELLRAFRGAARSSPAHVYLAGVSEGGLVVTLSVERSPDLYTGALAACGPIGSFRGQVDYVGDLRVVFDYFFPGVIPGSGVAIPDEVIRDWDSVYVPRIAAALAARPSVAIQFATVARLPLDWADPLGSLTTGALAVLWYNVFGANDAAAKLGGNPYGNIGRWYSGSSDDAALNAAIARIAPDGDAIAHLARYESTGQLARPVVTLHTLGDEVVPFWHEIAYYWKAASAGSSSFLTPLPVARYGHCTFTAQEFFGAFLLLVARSTPSA